MATLEQRIEKACQRSGIRPIRGSDLEPAHARRVWVVFGAGGERDQGKRALMGAAAAAGATRWCSPPTIPAGRTRPRSPLPSAIPGSEAVVEIDRRAAIHPAIDALRPGDGVLIAGKGHELLSLGRNGMDPLREVLVDALLDLDTGAEFIERVSRGRCAKVTTITTTIKRRT